MGRVMTQIVVFDTGAGGRIFAEHFRQEIPNVKIKEVIDSINAPYGSRTSSEILTLTENALKPFINSADIIVIACNTSTSNTITHLRTKYPNQIFVGTEPAIKPAAKLTKTGRILVLATPATLASARYKNLKNQYAQQLSIYEPNCKDWAKKIDTNTLTPAIISATLKPYQSYSPDVILLACTHYLSIPHHVFENIFPNIKIYSPLPAITDYVKSLLPQL
jgi:glutamate racemase